uniref:Uncharacterized protein n=1 Tax=Panagrolaimus sp. ES5 TaxID=591445 RepID=A0AC34F9K1_9BILA
MDSKSPDREWNVSFTDYSSHLLPYDGGYSLQHFINDGKVITVDGLTGRILWKKDFQSIIVNLYLLKTGGLQLLPSHSVGRKVFDAIIEVGFFIMNLLF